MSGARITHELERLFAEERPEAALRLLDELHGLRALSRQIRLPAELERVFARLREDGDEPPSMGEYLAALAACWERHTVQQLVDRLELRHEEVAALAPYATAALRGVGAVLGGRAWALVRQYLHRWRGVRPELRGDEVIALGVPRGPAVGAALLMLRDGRLRGELRTRAQEEVAVERWQRAAGAAHGGE